MGENEIKWMNVFSFVQTTRMYLQKFIVETHHHHQSNHRTKDMASSPPDSTQCWPDQPILWDTRTLPGGHVPANIHVSGAT